MDEAKLSREASRTTAAQSLLENDLFNEGIEAIERELIAAWADSQPRDTEGRERCWAAVQQVRRLKGYFESVLGDGKIAQAQLKELTTRPKRFGIV